MIWTWVAISAIGGIIVGAALGLWGFDKLITPDLRYRERNLKLRSAADLSSYFDVLQRELANWMVRQDPDHFVRVYKTAMHHVARIKSANRADQMSELQALAKEYPSFVDFDIVSARDYVLYDDTLQMWGYDKIEASYNDIIKFRCLSNALDDDWRHQEPPTNAKELEHLMEYVQKITDTRFKHKLKNAINAYYAYTAGFDAAKDNKSRYEYSNSAFSVRPVSHFAENRYGVHFKDTDEYGFYGFFIQDDAEKPPFESYYRSNEKFDRECGLHDLQIDTPI